MRRLVILSCALLSVAAFDHAPMMHNQSPSLTRSLPSLSRPRLALLAPVAAFPFASEFAFHERLALKGGQPTSAQRFCLGQCESLEKQEALGEAQPVHLRRRQLARLFAGGLLLVLLPCSPALAASFSPSSVLSIRQVSALVLACAAAGVWAENHTRLGSVLSGAMVSFFLGMALSSAGVLPAESSHVVYQIIQTYLLPLGVCQLMLGLEKDKIAQTLRASSSMLLAFLIASLGTLVGAVAAFKVVPLEQASNYAAVFTATYIGGTMNFIATADVLKFQDPQLLAAAFAADMVAMALYFAVLFYLAQRRTGPLERLGAAATARGGGEAAKAGSGGSLARTGAGGLSVEGLLGSVAAGSVVTWVGYLAAGWAGWAEGGVALSCLLALFASSTAPRALTASWSNAPELVGGCLLQLFFVSIGAGTNLRALLASEALLRLLAFIAVILLTQGAFLWLFASRWLRLELSDILLASNAAVGGSATAGGMAGALGWRNKVTPAVMCGTLGYIVGTAAGLAVSWITKGM